MNTIARAAAGPAVDVQHGGRRGESGSSRVVRAEYFCLTLFVVLDLAAVDVVEDASPTALACCPAWTSPARPSAAVFLL
ncbi:hypothetical protein [Streptomyces sp. WMMC897]|uniref:hypothetical protein n=1 Tax=Streptomyces sp. WMMC897 TaxID=3014782 RepID=UPI0022B5F04B|nr:hypothetical protein [Streptomyces sp. WMMC897]MCZ7417698.1 hypothetical protein [Streptomyces sp. WMMC897]